MSNSSVENQITRQIMYQLDCSRCMLRTTVIYLTSIDLRSRKRYKECNKMHTNTRTPFDPASQRICGWNRKCKLEITNEFSRSRNDFQVENIWRKKTIWNVEIEYIVFLPTTNLCHFIWIDASNSAFCCGWKMDFVSIFRLANEYEICLFSKKLFFLSLIHFLIAFWVHCLWHCRMQ